MPDEPERRKGGRPPKTPGTKYPKMLLTITPRMKEDLDFIASIHGINKSRALRLAFYAFYWSDFPIGKKAKATVKRLGEEEIRKELEYYKREDAKLIAKGLPPYEWEYY